MGDAVGRPANPAAMIGEPLPAFVNARQLFARGSSVLLPRKRMRVSEAAEAYRFITSGGQTTMWRNASVPYMVEPMDCTTSRDLEAVVFVGPSRSSKTAGMILNVLLHRITCAPCGTLLLHTTHDSARLFSMDHLDLMNRDCKAVRERLSRARNEDNIFDKIYQGMRLVIGWPTIQFLTSNDYELVLMTEYDRMPDNIGNEGSPFELGRKRTQTFGSRGMTVVECSPGREMIEREEPWEETGHEAEPTTGILDLFNQGDRRWLYWPCPHCNEFFPGRFKYLDWPKRPDGSPDGEIEDVAAEVDCVCPFCGSSAFPRHKDSMVADSRWLKEGQTIDANGNISGEGRRSKIGSFRMWGPQASFQTWSSIVANYLRAQEAFRRTGDHQTLKSVVNMDIGDIFVPPPAPGVEAMDAEVLRGRAEPGWKLGTVPAGVRALVMTIDVQGRYFDVQVTGLGVDFETWVVDRFQIAESRQEGRLVQPGSYAEDWELLWPLLERSWPLADDPSRAMRLLTTVIDSGGEPGVTGNAYQFAARARQKGISDQRLILLKGDARVGAKRVALTRIDWTKDGKVLAKGLHMLLVSSDDMKDDVYGGMKRADPGPGYLHTPHDLPSDWYDQACAEQKTSDRWAKRSNSVRNEAFDHLCYARAALRRPPFHWDRIVWNGADLRGYAQPHDRNTKVHPIESGDAAVPTPGFPPQSQPAPEAPSPPAPRAIGAGLARLAGLNARR